MVANAVIPVAAAAARTANFSVIPFSILWNVPT
jgi:hypothetical protein